MSVIKLTFDVVKDYIEIVKRQCNSLQEDQNNIETAYLKLGEEWSDNVYNLVGETLNITGKCSGKIYENIVNLIKNLVIFYNDMCEYNNTINKTIPNFNVETFICKIRKGEKMKIDINTDPEALKKFYGYLANYIESTKKLLNQIESNYHSIRDYWDGKQYRYFGQQIQEYKISLNKQLESLELCNVLIKRKYLELVEKLERPINGK